MFKIKPIQLTAIEIALCLAHKDFTHLEFVGETNNIANFTEGWNKGRVNIAKLMVLVEKEQNYMYLGVSSFTQISRALKEVGIEIGRTTRLDRTTREQEAIRYAKIDSLAGYDNYKHLL